VARFTPEEVSMRLQRLFPHLAGLTVDAVAVGEHAIVLTVWASRRTAACPLCGRRSARVHGRYWRSIADRACAGRRVTLRLRVRRFVCRSPACPRAIFAERFPALAGVRARRTHGQREALTDLGFALGGRPGARLAARLREPASRSTLLRLVRAAPEPPTPAPRVLGVDDFARRRGQIYGTIITDLETRRPIDLVPDRTAATLAAWLRRQPQVAVVARDRAGAYADGIRRGAPGAVQVADRFHLSRNAGEVLERVLTRHHPALRAAATAVDRATAVAVPVSPAAPPARAARLATAIPAGRPTRAEQDRRARQDRRRARYEAVVALHRQGHGPTRIARQVGLTRQTVARWLRADGLPERPRPAPRPRLVAPYEPYLRERWVAGCQNARQLWRELQARGFAGGAETVRRCVLAWRAEPARPGPPRRSPPPARRPAPPPPPTRPLSPRQARWLVLRPEAGLRPELQAYRAALLEAEPALVRAQALTAEFGRLVRERDHPALAPWLRDARGSGLPEAREFAKVLERDLAAVENALRYHWSNGVTEGHVNRLKLVKRSMYGRANADLLRKRVLRAA
jgi:transposase